MNIPYNIRKYACNVLFKIDTVLGRNNTLKVLCFHGFGNFSERYSISIKAFEQHIRKLNKYADFVGLDEVNNAISGKKYKRTQLLFTIDDGFKNVLDILPITQKYKIPVVLFILSNPSKASRRQLNNFESLLSWKDIKKLKNKGWVIGSHSATHTSFKKLTRPQIKKEMFDSKKIIEKNIGGKVTAFAYPRGVITSTVTKAVKSAGYIYGFGIDAHNVTTFSDRYNIPRTIIDKTHETSELPAVFTTTWLGIRRCTNRFGLWEKLLT